MIGKQPISLRTVQKLGIANNSAQNNTCIMQTYISFLRGINVGGHKLINMKELQKVFENLQYKEVKTYIQSGNIVFKATEENEQVLAKQIAENIHTCFGFEVPVLVIRATTLSIILENNPFLKRLNAEEKKIYFTFLLQNPLQENIEKFDNQAFAPEEFLITDKVVYLYCSNGYGNTKLSNPFLEKLLKVQATTRNLQTVLKMAELCK